MLFSLVPSTRLITLYLSYSMKERWKKLGNGLLTIEHCKYNMEKIKCMMNTRLDNNLLSPFLRDSNWLCKNSLSLLLNLQQRSVCKFTKPTVLYRQKELTVGLMKDFCLLSVRLRTTHTLGYKNFILMGCSQEEMR